MLMSVLLCRERFLEFNQRQRLDLHTALHKANSTLPNSNDAVHRLNAD